MPGNLYTPDLKLTPGDLREIDTRCLEVSCLAGNSLRAYFVKGEGDTARRIELGAAWANEGGRHERQTVTRPLNQRKISVHGNLKEGTAP
jgi:hypothetical protein